MAGIKAVDEDDDIILISQEGVIIRIEASSVRQCARPAKGVKVMRLQEGDRVVTLARVPHEDPPEEGEELPEDEAGEEEPAEELETE